MIGDDQIQPEPPRGFRGSKRANASINADDKFYACGGGILENIIPHAVAFANAMRNVEVGDTAEQFDAGLQDYDCGRSVHVIIAVDKQRLFGCDGPLQSLDCDLHSQHGVRIV